MQRIFEELFIVRCGILHSGFSAYKNKFHQKYLTSTSTVQERTTFYKKILSLTELQYALNSDAEKRYVAILGKRVHCSTDSSNLLPHTAARSLFT
jgi:hypothetical protein